MQRRRTNGMEVTLKVISHLVKQHVCVLVADSLWLSSDIKLTQAGIFYVFKDGKFHGCLRIELEPLRFNFNEMMSVSTYALQVNPSRGTKKSDLQEQISDDSRTSKRKPATPRRLGRSVEHYASTPKVSFNIESGDILEKSGLSPITSNTLEEDQSSHITTAASSQPVFPPQPVLLSICEGDEGKNQSGEQITDQVKTISAQNSQDPAGYEATEYACRKCGEQFTTIDGYYVHMFSMHKIRNKKRHKPIIKRVFQKLDGNTKSQEKVPSKDDSMDCGYCDKHYLTHLSLRNHLINVHKDQPAYFCDNCNRVFYVDSVRDSHCANCFHDEGSKEKSESTPNYHFRERKVIMVSGEKKSVGTELVLNGPLKCHLCRIGLHTEQALLLHIKAHKQGKPIDAEYIAERKKTNQDEDSDGLEFFNENTISQSEEEQDVDETPKMSPKKKVRVINTETTPKKNKRKRKHSSSSLTPSRKSPRIASKDIYKTQKSEEQTTETKQSNQSMSKEK